MSREPPLRLRDDPAIARALRNDLAQASARARAGYDVAAGLARFEATARAGGAAGAGGVAGARTVLGAAFKGALLGLAVVGGAAAVGDHAPARPPLTGVEAPLTASALVAAPLAPSLSVPVEVTVTSAPSVPPRGAARPAAPPGLAERAGRSASPEPAPLPPAAPAPGTAVAPASEPVPPPAPATGDALAAEMDHLVRLRALQDSDAAQALALAADGQRRFSAGYFAQEREAIAIAALVRLGRLAEARVRAGAFLATYPRSAFAARIRNLTGPGGAR